MKKTACRLDCILRENRLRLKAVMVHKRHCISLWSRRAEPEESIPPL
ncbi:MAG: hypothetical protein J6I50_07800 [Clostridia bacterium]|nr:hypothetical protein [Clostridia bacterium]